MKLAEELRQLVNEKNNTDIERKAKSIVDAVIAEAKKVAKTGNSNVRYYSDYLGSTDIDKRVRAALIENGFTVRITEDSAYTKHAGSIQMYVEITW